MAQPTPYDRLYNFTEYATANPSAPYQAAYTDAELNAIQTSIEETLVNLSLIQRDDGALKNGVVTQDSLSTTLAALFAAEGSTIRGDWVTATAYALKDVVTQGGVTYICAVAHTSGTFATDLAADKWVPLNSGTTIAAANVTCTPSGTVAATNVDAAIAELASEKLQKSSNLSDVASRATAFTNLVAGGGTMTGTLAFSGATARFGAELDVVSATTLNISAITSNQINITFSNTIAAITSGYLGPIFARTSGAPTFTHSSTLVCPGGRDLVTEAGDTCILLPNSAGNGWYIWNYQRGTGLPLSGIPKVLAPTTVLGGNALTVKLPVGSPLMFSDGTLFTTTVQLAVQVTSGSTLGTTNGVASRLWVVAMYNSGTPELAIINTWDGADVYSIFPGDTISTVAEGGAGAADSAHVWYSLTARSSQAIAIVGYVESTQATAGTWATSPSLVQGYGVGLPLPGQSVQTRRSTITAVGTNAATTPVDNTAPTITEGAAFTSVSLTVKSALNVLRARGWVMGAFATAANGVISALHLGSADAFAASISGASATAAYVNGAVNGQVVAGSAGAVTVAYRQGVTGGTFYANGNAAGTRLFGGADSSGLEVAEIMR